MKVNPPNQKVHSTNITVYIHHNITNTTSDTERQIHDQLIQADELPKANHITHQLYLIRKIILIKMTIKNSIHTTMKFT